MQGLSSSCLAHGAVLMHGMGVMARGAAQPYSGAAAGAGASSTLDALAHACITSVRLEPSFLLAL